MYAKYLRTLWAPAHPIDEISSDSIVKRYEVQIFVNKTNAEEVIAASTLV